MNSRFSVWKMSKAFTALSLKLSIEEINSVYEFVFEFQFSRCSSNSAAFLLLIIETLLSVPKKDIDLNQKEQVSVEVDRTDLILKTVQVLVNFLHFDLAHQLDLPLISDCIAAAVKSKTLKLSSIHSMKLLHFAPSAAVTIEDLKFLNEIKGLPHEIEDLLPFLSAHFMVIGKNEDFINLVDRLSRRNPSLAAAILCQVSKHFTVMSERSYSEPIDPVLYISIIHVLIPCEVEIIQKYLQVISLNISSRLNDKFISALFSTFRAISSASVKVKEFYCKFLSSALSKYNTTSSCSLESSVDFVDICSKELNNSEFALSSLIQFALIFNQNNPSLLTFLKTNLKASQKITIRSTILFGAVKANNNSFLRILKNEPVLLKEVLNSLSSSLSTLNSANMLTLFTASLIILIKSDCSEISSELLLSLGKQLFCEKGWSGMDRVLVPFFLEAMCNIIFSSASDNPKAALLYSFAVKSVAWFTVNGSKPNFRSIIGLATPLTTPSTVDQFAEAFEKLQTSPDASSSESVALRIWTLFHRIVSSSTLSSRSLALLCHGKSLLGLGAGSWTELVRSKLSNDQEIDSFVELVIPIFITTDDYQRDSFFLIQSLVALSPVAVLNYLQLNQRVADSANELMCAYCDSLAVTVVPASAPRVVLKSTGNLKSPGLKSPSIESSTNDKLVDLISVFKHHLFILRAASLAIPFHQAFVQIRSDSLIILFKVLEKFANFNESDLIPILISSLYDISRESFNGHGPLLLTLLLISLNLSKFIDNSWNITVQSTFIESALEIIEKNTEINEFVVAAFLVTRIVRFSGKLIYSFSERLVGLFNRLIVISRSFLIHSVDSSVMFEFIHVLLELSKKNTTFSNLITLLLVEFGEYLTLKMTISESNAFNNFIKSAASPQLLLAPLKFLASYATTHKQSTGICENLFKTIWLLHNEPTETCTPDKETEVNTDEEPEMFSGLEDKSYIYKEVTQVAIELYNLIGLEFTSQPPLTLSVLLSEIALLEVPDRGEHVKNLLPFYIASTASLCKNIQDSELIFAEFNRLISVRSVPVGVVRLNKNVDRSTLDFSKLTRHALLQAISSAVMSISNSEFVSRYFKFCFEFGFNDPDESNSELLFTSTLQLVDSSVETNLYNQLQHFMASIEKDNDRVKVYSVILVGRTASKFAMSADNIWELIYKIKESLNVPSEKVQKAVADTMVPLLKTQSNDSRISALATSFENRIRDPKEDYGSLRGAAFGLAALLEACGTNLIRSHQLFCLWTDGLSKLNQKNSELIVCAALASIEITSRRCGVVFEPYIPPLVPRVLEALGDSRSRLREDAEACADAMMSALSPLSVALILPPLLDSAGMDGCDLRYSWRAKLGAVTWLGSMACLAPKVLTPALPRIIPSLIVALTDAHEKVHMAAHHALAVKYAAIIRSPEIKAALPAILRALSDPPRFASSCLGDIIGTSFCHAVDGPSLALLEPLLTRALCERGTGGMTEAKRRAILVIANLGSLMDPLELRPYLVNLVPALKSVLGDAVPQVRSGAARALGVLMKLMNTIHSDVDISALTNLAPECLEIVFSSNNSVTAIDRAGAAQAIAQVTASKGFSYLVDLINERVAPVLFNSAVSSTAASREALLHLCAAIPAALSLTQISELYSSIFTSSRLFSILQNTIDEDEGVREVATKTIRTLILRQALLVDLDSAMEILLKGTADPRWRIRLTSITILADLLPALSIDASTAVARCNTESRLLSSEMRCRVLSRLFLGRFDCNGAIRNASFSLWKSIVTHPPRVILEILPILVDDCVAALDSAIDYSEDNVDDEDDYEDEEEDSEESAVDEPIQRQTSSIKIDRYEMASNALADILTKLSDRILFPLLRRLLSNCSNYGAGVISAANIITSIVIIPTLKPQHLRGSTVVVNVGRAEVDEALKVVLQIMKQGLQNKSDVIVGVAVGLFGRISTGLSTSPILLERIISEFFEESDNLPAIISILIRRPLILLPSLVNRFKKLTTTSPTIDFDWWSQVFSASGPFIAPHASALLVHTLKLTSDQITDDNSELIDSFVSSISSYDCEIEYGDTSYDQDDDNSDEFNLDEEVNSGLFSFGQTLETLWSARGLHMLGAQLILRFCSHGSNGVDRLYDTWPDRLLVALSCENSSPEDNLEVYSEALESLIERSVERGDSLTLINALLQTIETRSVVKKMLKSKGLPVELSTFLVKSLCLPVISDSDALNSDRILSADLLSTLVSTEYPSRLASGSTTAILGALIRCLSDRSATEGLKTDRLKAALLPILPNLLISASTACKPFHPQLSRMIVNILKDYIATNPDPLILSSVIPTIDAPHPRHEIVRTAGQIAALLCLHMTRIDSLLDELKSFALFDETSIYDTASMRNARRVLLFIIKSAVSFSNQSIFSANLSAFISEIIRALIILPSNEIEIIKEASKVGLESIQCLHESYSNDLKSYVTSLI